MAQTAKKEDHQQEHEKEREGVAAGPLVAQILAALLSNPQFRQLVEDLVNRILARRAPAQNTAVDKDWVRREIALHKAGESDETRAQTNP